MGGARWARSVSHLVVVLVDLQVDGDTQDDATADLQP